jgi:Ca-activated chloride channel homolog
VSFDSPLLLLTLLVVPVAVGLYLLAERRRMRYAMRFTNLDVLASVVGRRAWRRYVPPLLFLLAVAAACIAVARPHATTLVPSECATVILVIDVSRSMQARDVKPTRLLAAKAAVRTFLERVPNRLRLGLVAFAGEPHVAAPPTTDRALVRESLDHIGEFPGFGGTAIGDALAAAVQLGQQALRGDGRNLASARTAAPAPEERDLVSILFLSDGRQTRGLLRPLEGAARAKAAGIRVYTVSLGTPNGTLERGFGGSFGPGGGGGGGGGFGFGGRIPVRPDPATLRAVARSTGGEFFDARSAGAVKSAYEKLGSSLGRKRSRTEVGYAFLACAAALLVAAGLLSARWSARLP